MRRIFFLTALLLSILFCTAALSAGGGKTYTFKGTLEEDDGLIILKGKELTQQIVIATVTDGLEDLSSSLYDCVLDFNTGGYKGVVEVSGTVWSPEWSQNEFRIEGKEATCRQAQ